MLVGCQLRNDQRCWCNFRTVSTVPNLQNDFFKNSFQADFGEKLVLNAGSFFFKTEVINSPSFYEGSGWSGAILGNRPYVAKNLSSNAASTQ